MVYVYENNNKILGYYSIVEIKDTLEVSGIVMHKGLWLEHMFLSPKNIGKGLGSEMFTHICETCLLKGTYEVGILADPNTKGFYEKMCCEYQKEFPSTIPNRTTPWLTYTKFNKS
jgi:GNAT superfamily N-acetyltransferase